MTVLHASHNPVLKNIGFFTDDFFPYRGGMGRYVHEVTSRLPLPLKVFSPTSSQLPFHIKVRPFLNRHLRNISYSLWLNANLPRIISQHDLSVINLQCGPGGLFLLRDCRLPVVATCHHTWWQQSSYIAEQKWKRIFIPFERYTYQIATRIICDASDTQRVLVEKYGIDEKKISIIPIGVNRDTFHPEANVHPESNSLIYIGRLERRKGIDFLLRALPLVKEQIPDIKLYIVGRGEMPPHLAKVISDNDLHGNIIRLGFVEDDILNNWYNKVTCCVVPSVFEGFGLTAIEALAAGTPVVATDVDGLRSIINNENNGLLARYGDTRSLADCIVRILRNKVLRSQLIKQGLTDTDTTYNWDRIIKTTLKFYQEL